MELLFLGPLSVGSGRRAIEIGRPGVTPLTGAECLGRFLRALGVPVADVPPNAEEAAALFRSLMVNRRMLIVLDNAASVGQVSGLLPGGVGASVIITSRRLLATLSGATQLQVPPLAPDDARLMAERLVGGRNIGPQLPRLTELCGYLPLAIKLAATRRNNHPGWTIDLDREAARALTLMGALGLRTVDVGAAAALLAAPQLVRTGPRTAGRVSSAGDRRIRTVLVPRPGRALRLGDGEGCVAQRDFPWTRRESPTSRSHDLPVGGGLMSTLNHDTRSTR